MSDTVALVTAPSDLIEKMDAYAQLGRVVDVSLKEEREVKKKFSDNPLQLKSALETVRQNFKEALPPSKHLFKDHTHLQVGLEAATLWVGLYSTVLEHVTDFVRKTHKRQAFTPDEIARWYRLADDLEKGLESMIAFSGDIAIFQHRRENSAAASTPK